MAAGANDTQFDADIRTVFIFSESSLDFSFLHFEDQVASLPTLRGQNVYKSIFPKQTL